MLRFQRVVSCNSEAGDTDMADGDPAFDLVVAKTVHPVGKTYRRDGSSSFQAGKSSGVIDYVVGNQNFISSARLEITGGSVIQASEDTDTGEQKDVRPVPECMGRYGRLRRRRWGWRCRGGLTRLCRLLAEDRRGDPNADREQQNRDEERTLGHFRIVAGNSWRDWLLAYLCYPATLPAFIIVRFTHDSGRAGNGGFL